MEPTVKRQMVKPPEGEGTHIWKEIGPLHDPVTWYQIKYTGEQVARWDFQNNAPAFALEFSLRNLLTSMFNFVPCDRVVQRAYKAGKFLKKLWG